MNECIIHIFKKNNYNYIIYKKVQKKKKIVQLFYFNGRYI